MTTYRLMIKKLLLLTGLTISTSLWADMDNRCFLNAEKIFTASKQQAYILANCERNNILHLVNIFEGALPIVISQFCRYDRNITEHQSKSITGVTTLTCLLYDNEPRKIIKAK